MPVARPESSDARIIAHIDMDCFYVQVEQRKQPNLRGKPTAVIQYNSWKGGGLIAVSYEAREYGVKRSMRGDEAKQVCPQIQLVRVPVARGKADLSIYRNAGSEVVSIFARTGRCERASIDEVYLDLTDAAEIMLAETPPESLEAIPEEVLKSHVLGLNQDGNDVDENVREWLRRSNADHRDKLLACGALIVAELRLQVLKETEFTCSAGVAHNKMLAKLASGMNKPAQQTVVPFSSVMGLLKPLPIKKMKQLGGKLGSSLQVDLGVNTVGDLLQFSEEKLQECYGINTGTWLWNIARGISGEEVEGRLLPKSHGSGKTFPGPRALKTTASVEHWLNELCEELSERLHSDLDQNKRIAHTLTLHVRAYKSGDSDSHKKFPSKSCPLRYGTAKIQEDAFNLFQAGLREYLDLFRVKIQNSQYNGWGITALSVSAGKIVAIPSGTCSITKYFHGQDQSFSYPKQSNDRFIQEAELSSASGSDTYQTEPKTELCGEEIGIKNVMPSLDQHEHERKMIKEQETSSILRFFQSLNSCSSSKQEHVETVRETEASTSSGSKSVGNICPDLIKAEPSQEIQLAETWTNSSALSLGGDEQRKDVWSYNIAEIDPSVINELPLEIQDEVRAWLRPHKRSNSARRGPSIANYFLPAKNT
ncbi:DNA polymerase eta isoform X3 [Cornus florida]|uniref:DNA polymerase eta isoform X3 n=1 Tax=Cornus florida TaxID=4283 RepID=UPI0028A1D1AC|nr:DNA polymerase eta isoform X3 [Cornus florida]